MVILMYLIFNKGLFRWPGIPLFKKKVASTSNTLYNYLFIQRPSPLNTTWGFSL